MGPTDEERAEVKPIAREAEDGLRATVYVVEGHDGLYGLFSSESKAAGWIAAELVGESGVTISRWTLDNPGDAD